MGSMQFDGRFTRRKFIKVNAATGATLVLGGGLLTAAPGCGGSSDDDSSSSSITESDVAEATGTITVLSFSFYEAPAFNGGPVKAKYAEVAGGDEIVTKIRTLPDLDVAVTGSNVVDQLRTIDELAPIDTALLSNYEDIDQSLRDTPGFTEGSDVYAIPVTVTPSVTAWNSDVVPEPRTSDDLLSADYSGQVGLYDDAGTILQVAQMLGLDMYNFTLEDLDEVSAYLEELKPNVKTIYVFGDEVQLFARGDISVAFVTFGSLLTSIQKNNKAVGANLLGAVSFVDSWSIPTDAEENLAAAMNWIDNTLTVPSQKSLVATAGTQPAVQAAFDPSLYPKPLADLSLSELLEQAPPIPGAPVEGEGLVTLDLLQETWSNYKASF